jgi:hypothetical protein
MRRAPSRAGRAAGIVTAVALALASAACARTGTTPAVSEDAVAQGAQSRANGAEMPAWGWVLLGAGVVLVLALATADSDPFLDYSGICGTPDCS